MKNKHILLGNITVAALMVAAVGSIQVPIAFADASTSLFSSNASSNVSQDSSSTASVSSPTNLFSSSTSSNINQDSSSTASSSPSTNPNQDNTGSFGNNSSTNPNQDSSSLFGNNPSTNPNQDSGGGSAQISYTITTSVTGSGTITCGGSTCPASVNAGTSVTFTANPSSNYTFTSWGGACSGTSNTCTLVVNSNESVSATFTSTSNNGGNNNGGGTTGGGGSTSSSGSYVGGGFSAVPLAGTVLTSATTSCPLITIIPLKFGVTNNKDQVVALQIFLKDSEKLNVDITGIFDQKTLAAVSAFQQKYVVDIMGPWGSRTPSGEVYITTKNKINELACAKPIALTAAEQDIIASYRANETGSATSTTGSIQTQNGSSTNSLAPDVGLNASTTFGSSQTASVGGFASYWNNFWSSIFNSLKKIF
ncbi:MAG: peptidoglycan-binding protein [Patescibacteria group bacterium]|nr:peptidoglycan-binding protein [Patescibacteria group bacterium]